MWSSIQTASLAAQHVRLTCTESLFVRDKYISPLPESARALTGGSMSLQVSDRQPAIRSNLGEPHVTLRT